MAGNNGQASGLEDQLRRMILNNGQDASLPPMERPTVRLPPSAPNHAHAHEQKQPANRPPRGPPHRTTQGYGASVPTAPSGGATPAPQPAANGRSSARPNQKQRRPQSQTQIVTPNGSIVSTQAMPHGREQHRQQTQYRPPQPSQMDPNAFQRGGQVAGYYQRPQPPPRQLFDPNSVRGPPPNYQAEQHMRQAQYLDQIASVEVANVAMSSSEREEKEAFRTRLEKVVHEVCAANPDRLPEVSLESFGSFKSGFANAGSDMDLVIVLPDGSPFTADFGLLEDDLPRALEKRLLQLGYGARLLSRTRVPIIKICEKPHASLLDKLREERDKWDMLDNEKKYPHLHPIGNEDDEENVAVAASGAEAKPDATVPVTVPATKQNDATQTRVNDNTKAVAQQAVTDGNATDPQNTNPEYAPSSNPDPVQQARPKRDNRPFTRERRMGPLDFPSNGVGIASDINFFNPLGLHNTQLLRCYSLCDPRVQPMVFFVKSWAKRRKINSSYSGTLSSYGYVLMVLHYLVNVARPAVLPNLQLPWRPNAQSTLMGGSRVECDGWVVDFWRNEDEIIKAVKAGQMSSNHESLGSLLEGFFRFYSSMGGGPQFHWVGSVLSLRSPNGILSKENKGWVKAVTQEGEGKKVQHRYLFCIEDPFELQHNVARTVTHFGIVAIRDEFRRARRILTAIGFGQTHDQDGELLDELVEKEVVAPAADVDGSAQVSAAANTASGIARPDASGSNMRDGVLQKPARFPQNKQSSPMNSAKARPPQPRQFNFTDRDAFPTLGRAKANSSARTTTTTTPQKFEVSEMSEISGDRARAYLEEVKRKKAEADAELTATGAAEAVLGGE